MPIGTDNVKEVATSTIPIVMACASSILAADRTSVAIAMLPTPNGKKVPIE